MPSTVWGTAPIQNLQVEIGAVLTRKSGRHSPLCRQRSLDLASRTYVQAKQIFRFFDTKFGTHFFTGNAGERDTAIATRPDLIYEPNSTFYEHATQQSGDVAVYRLFDTQYGTHFYTGDQNEYNNITTAGSSSYRADLKPEGIEFYAPAGSFT